MGPLPQGPTLQDLKVTILSSTTLYPAEKTEGRSMFLSNIDQILNFDVETIHFFAANLEFPAAVVVERLSSALEKVLVPYDFLAGRLKLEPGDGRLVIDCNAAGVKLVVASSELKLEEVGDLQCPNPAFRQLVAANPDNGLALEDRPLCSFQVTSFKCGGFALGICNNHITFDGLSFQAFLQNLAAVASNRPLATTPCNDRHLLAARSPPRVTFPHPELITHPSIPHPNQHPPSTLLDSLSSYLQFHLFHLGPDDISTLKNKAKTSSPPAASSFNVVAAHLWRCKALASSKCNSNKSSTILYAVDLRSRLKPPLPNSYAGNAVLSAYATAPCGDLEKGPFARIVELVYKGAERMTDEYARSVIDWGQLNQGFPWGDVVVSSWLRLGFSEVEYPWGRPKHSCPVGNPQWDIILLFPTIGKEGKGMNALVALPIEDVEKFRSLFYKFLAGDVVRS
ncbi:acyltransferase GLAUCE [Elaeis guineensis]|uniref:Fatty alcohol:caffeoyl-CoA acyltransferase n=1 Tax=Elaeis guineensis var. tenera TaxID=51953 RepID=A0A6I9QNC4_ELAGV|nr:fatty alcohol:caffeoyl-CoA acyltransferase [Elaeis guineensis]